MREGNVYKTYFSGLLMTDKKLTKKNDFVSIEFTGKSEGKVFDSNRKEDLKDINPKVESSELVVVIGQGMVVPGLDKALEEKEIGKSYDVSIYAKEGFGERKREMVKTIPLKVFTQQKINPYPGAVLMMDQMMVRIISVSGGRVLADFNNPLSGKDLEYNFKIVKKIEDDKERCKSLFKHLFRMIPEFEVGEKEVTVKGRKEMEMFVNALSGRFKEILGKDLKFKLEEDSVDFLSTEKKKAEEGKNIEGDKESKLNEEEGLGSNGMIDEKKEEISQ
jgi:FKBP-type peptidyl-prolyl cis-trans isomerase 2